MKIVTLLAVLTFLSIVVFRLIRDGLKHRRVMKNLKKWSAYHKQLTDWASEIQDLKVREEFVTECIQNLINHDARDIRFIQDFDVDLEKEKLFNKWGSHIASLRQEIRHKRLKRLV